jgi:hypothetical protein
MTRRVHQYKKSSTVPLYKNLHVMDLILSCSLWDTRVMALGVRLNPAYSISFTQSELIYPNYVEETVTSEHSFEKRAEYTHFRRSSGDAIALVPMIRNRRQNHV